MSYTRFFVVSSLLLGLFSACACGAVPSTLSYQGKLMQPSGATVPDGTYSIVFSIYDVATGGTALWTETNSSVQVKSGLFSVLLGSVDALPGSLFTGADRWFGVKVGADNEMTPRQQIASVGYAQIAGNGNPPGTVVAYAGANPPDGYLLCNGQTVSRTTYTALFAAIGTAYGAGDGSTTFGLPDLAGKFALGANASHALATGGGSETQNLSHTHTTAGHTLTTSEMPSHNHGVTDPTHRHSAPSNSAGTQFSSGSAGYAPNMGSYYTGYASTGISIGNTGSGAAHNHGNTTSSLSTTQDVMNPFTTVNYIIKY